MTKINIFKKLRTKMNQNKRYKYQNKNRFRKNQVVDDLSK